jgi:tRNA pseudouridine13 synthase
MPNLFGPQRFGLGGRNVVDGLAVLKGEDSPRFRKRKRFLVSAAQAELFNVYLIERMKAASANQVMNGDVLRRGRGFFVAEDEAAEQARVDGGEVTLTGPLFGPRSPRPAEGSEPRRLEDHILDSYGLTLEDFRAQKRIGRGGRRDLAVRPENATAVQPDQTTGTLELRFTLPPGSYATVLIREVLKVPFRSLRPGSKGRQEQTNGLEG